MTTPNIEELIAKLRTSMGDLDCPNTYEFAMHQAADALQSQAERIVELEKLLQNGSEIIAGLFARAANMEAERDTLRVQLAAIAATEPVFYEFQWTNPGNQPHQPESMFVWARVEPAWNGTVQQKVDELLAYRYDDKPTYRVRALFTRPMPAQDVAELVEALEALIESITGVDQVSVVNDARTALSKYKGAK